MTLENFIYSAVVKGVWVHRYSYGPGGERYCLTFGKRRFMLNIVIGSNGKTHWVTECDGFPPRGKCFGPSMSMEGFYSTIVFPVTKNKS